jgi:DNA-directed RNA polymerase specialized sigma24 family protein
MSQAIDLVIDQGVTPLLRRRKDVEQVLELAQHLPEADRLLIEQIYRHGRPAAELARLLGCRPRLVQRRVSILLKRLRQPLFRFLVNHQQLLPRDLRPIARRAVFEGCSLRRTAQLTGRSLHHIRQDMRTVQMLAQLWG